MPQRLSLNLDQDFKGRSFTLDVQWFLSDPAGNDLINAATATPFGERGRTVGLLPSGEDDQFAVRAQFQLLF